MQDDIRRLAQILWDAEQQREPAQPLREQFPGLGVAHAYAVQRAVSELRETAGAQRAGWKVGLSSVEMLQRSGMDEPFWAPIFDSGQHGSGSTLAVKRFQFPRIEVEVALVLGVDLDHRRISLEEARAAIATVHPAFEIVDVRTTVRHLDALESIADSGWHAGFVLGPGLPAADIDLSAVTARVLEDFPETTGHIGKASILIDGGPVSCLRWLAERALASRQPLRAGDVILSGTILPVLPLVSGATITAEFTGLGAEPVTVSVGGR